MVSPKSSSEDLPGLYQRQSSTPRSTGPFARLAIASGIAAALLLFYLSVSSAGLSSLPSFTDAVSFTKPKTSLGSWIETEESIAYDQIYQNLGGGARAKDAALGAVIASPSTEEPDYYYQWVRDAAITYKTIIGQYIQG